MYDNIRFVARRAILVLLALYWIIIFAGTHSEATSSPGFELNDKVLHFLAYSGLGFLLSWSILRLSPSREGIVLVLVVIATYGVGDELSQIFVPTREADIRDWVADILGGLFGLGLYFGTSWLVLTRILLPYRASLVARNDAT